MFKNFIIYSILLLRWKDLTFKMSLILMTKTFFKSKTSEIPFNAVSFEQISGKTRTRTRIRTRIVFLWKQWSVKNVISGILVVNNGFACANQHFY
jgi:hypothetical protein